MRVLVAGGTGLIGQPLVQALLARGDTVTVLGRSEAKIADVFGDAVAATTLGQLTAARTCDFDAVVNLAGENVGASMRWSRDTLREILDSRVNLTSGLAKLIASGGSQARLLNSSGISIYGYKEEDVRGVKDEDTATPEQSVDPLTEVTAHWERAALQHLPEGHPVVLLRTGIVLARGAGALGKMELPFRLGLGGRLGSGKQGLSWISLRDTVGALLFLLDHPEVTGAVNITTGFVDQASFAQALASALYRPCLLPAPGFAIKMLLGGDMARALVLSNYCIDPKRLKDAGYSFQDTDLAVTLRDLYA
mmetsp:Transcript_13264/g.27555  ORF Transcript_13264/g.27555 Transcript_13264/m.27555 type:complete len:307 (-) Transcript_13264:100-1020(-)